MQQASIEQVDRDLYLITLPQPMIGFERFISAWLVTGESTLLIDVGPSASVFLLLSALEELGVRELDAVLITHIHLDHAGGVGEVAARWPGVPIYCHPKAIQHLSDPARLWEGSLKNLGDLARAYGPLTPVPENRLIDAAACHLSQVAPIFTPGHALHHISYLIGDTLFAGEAGGVCIQLSNGSLYMRPATPPRFFLETSLESIDILMKIPAGRICYGHFGIEANPVTLLQQHRDQLLHWRDVIAGDVEKGMEDDPQAILNHLLTVDNQMQGWQLLSEPVRHREQGFLLSSVKGFLGYLQAEGGR